MAGPSFPRKSKGHSDQSYWASRAKRSIRRAKHTRKMRVMSIAATVVIAGVLLATASGVGAVVYFSKDLPSPDRLTEREIAQTTKIYSRQGDLLYEIFDEEKRTLITLDQIPEHLKQATLSAEDADFYKHSGFDVMGILRSAYYMISSGQIQGGGSTITQQLVKNVFLSPERTFTRKLKEVILAMQLEAKFSKDEILQMYFNEVGYGGNYYGVGAASEGYFGKAVADLTLEEAAFLAGLPQSPSIYSPRSGDPELALARYELVLDLMNRFGYLTEEQANTAKEVDVLAAVKPLDANIRAPHFVFYVRQELMKQFGEKTVEQGGLKVTTTLDMGKQIIAEEEVRFQLDRLAQRKANVNNQALVSVNPKTGEVLSMVGSADYFNEEIDGEVNVTLARRQPGSAIKPIVYIRGLQMGYTAASFLPDISACFGIGGDGKEYCPGNSDGRFWGPLSMREALANSRNTPAVRMGQLIGVHNIIEQAQELGITTLDQPERYGLSLSLGSGEVKPIELANAYAAFANSGQQYDLISILKVEDSSGKVIFENKLDERKAKQVVPAEHAYVLTHILSDNEARKRLFGANNMLEIGRPAGVKTGTTNDNKDAWTCGYVPQLATCVWTGNTDNTPMAQNIQGSTGATPTFHHYMRRALEGVPVEDFVRPAGIVEATVDRLSGKLPREGASYPTKVDVFVRGTVPTEIDDFHQTVEICTSKGLLATDYHRLIGDVEKKTYTYIIEPNPSLQKYSDEWMSKTEGYGKPPTETCPIIDDQGNRLEGPYVQIIAPADDTELSDTTFQVTAEAYSEERILKLEFYWDDTLVKTVTSAPYTVEFSVSQDTSGSHSVKVVAFDGAGDQSEDSVTVNFPDEDEVTPTPTPEDDDGGPGIFPSGIFQ